ncbi:putative immunity protein [Arthrobacter sp. 2MCAF14]|uniref:putative immunity protein n=1 Tax=Arthrobacter sp. 2MCAF14 TaxID=3232982 RepID=UPI003F8FDDD6
MGHNAVSAQDGPAHRAAAWAAGQAAGVAHMGAHALGAAAYAAKAAGLAAPDQPTAISEEISWQLEHMNARYPGPAGCRDLDGGRHGAHRSQRHADGRPVPDDTTCTRVPCLDDRPAEAQAASADSRLPSPAPYSVSRPRRPHRGVTIGLEEL